MAVSTLEDIMEEMRRRLAVVTQDDPDRVRKIHEILAWRDIQLRIREEYLDGLARNGLVLEARFVEPNNNGSYPVAGVQNYLS